MGPRAVLLGACLALLGTAGLVPAMARSSAKGAPPGAERARPALDVEGSWCSVEWLTRPLPVGSDRTSPVARVVIQAPEGGGRSLDRVLFEPVALPDGVRVASLLGTFRWSGGGLGGGVPLDSRRLEIVLPPEAAGEVEVELGVRLEADGAFDLEGPVQWLLELTSAAGSTRRELSGAAGRAAALVFEPAVDGGAGAGGSKGADQARGAQETKGARGGGKLPPAAIAASGPAKGADDTRVLLAAFPAVRPRGELRIARSEDSGRTWQVGPPRWKASEGDAPGAVLTERPTLLWDPRERTFRLLLEGPEGGGLAELVSADLGRTWSGPTPVSLTGEVAGEGLLPMGGRGVRTASGEVLWPVSRTGPDGAEAYGLLRRGDDGVWRLGPTSPTGLTRACFVELGDDAVLASAASSRSAGRDLRLWRLRDDGWRAPLRTPDPSLPCAGGAAAMLHVGRGLFGLMDGRLVTANAAVRRKPPSRMVVRGSNDSGSSWPEGRAVLLDDGRAVGGPGLVLADEDSLGVLYRSSGGSLVFQSIPLPEVVDPVGGIGSVLGGR